jgi:transcriptional regulator with XRE-family HTH domain
MNNIEQGKVDPRASRVCTIAQVLGVSADYLLGLGGMEMPPTPSPRHSRASRRKKPQEPALPEGAEPRTPEASRPIDEQRQWIRERQHQLAERRSRQEAERQQQLPAAEQRPLLTHEQRHQLAERRLRQVAEWQQQLAEWQQQLDELDEQIDEQRGAGQQQRGAGQDQQQGEEAKAPRQLPLALGRGVSPARTAQAIVEAMGSEYAARLVHELTVRVQAAPAHQYAAPAGTKKDE